MDNQQIAQVNSCKFLGAYIDEHLSWSDCIIKLSQKISKSIRTIN